MSREEFDIPEVFRRAMEEAGWRTDEDENGGNRPPRRPLPLRHLLRDLAVHSF